MAQGTALTAEELKKLGQGALDFKASLPQAATPPTGSVAMIGPILPGQSRPNVTPVSANGTDGQTPLTGTLQGPYANPNGGYQAGLDVVNGKPQYNQPTPTAQPVSASQANSYTPPDYAALAAARTAAALARKKTIAEQQKASLDSSYARSNQITQDNRTLEDGQINRTLNPFSGKTAFDKGIIGRERTLVDETSAGNLQSQKANIDQLLADYQDATAEEQVRIADELERADRAYKLDLDTFNQNQSNWQQTFDQNGQNNSFNQNLQTGQFNQNQQVIDYNQDPNNPSNQGQVIQNQGNTIQNQIAQLQLKDYPAQSQAQATLLQQQVKSGQMSNEAAAYNLQQLKDPKSTMNQAADIDLQLKKLDLKNAPETARLQLQQLQKQIAEIGKVHTTPQTATEIEMDNVRLQTAKEQLKQLQNPTAKPTVIDSKESTDNLTFYQGQLDSRPNLSFDQQISYAQSQKPGLSDSDYDKLIAYINKVNGK